MPLIDHLLLVAATALLLPTAVLGAQVLAAMGRAARIPEMSARRPRAVVLVPAHDEARGILPTLEALRGQLGPHDRIVVVADNCTDDTAGVARRAGAAVVERHDTGRRGKSYALEFGLERISGDAPEVVVVMDADCVPAPGCIEMLSRRCGHTNGPVQARFDMTLRPGAGAMGRIAAFAWLMKNRVRSLGYRALGLPCQLMGTGTAFPWQLLRGTNVANGHLAEDYALGLELAMSGHAPSYLDETSVRSAFPESREGRRSQQTRWEHGQLRVRLEMVPAMVWRAIRSLDRRLLALAIDMFVPPLALLALQVGGILAISLLLRAFEEHAHAWMVAGLGALILFAAVIAAWARFGRDVVGLADLLQVPIYSLRKVPMYVRFWTARERNWVRTARDGEGEGAGVRPPAGEP